MAFSQFCAVISVSRFIKFFVLLSAVLLGSCLNDESSKVDVHSVVGSWYGEAESLFWCFDMSEDELYRHVQYIKGSEELLFQSGRFELQRGKRIFLTLTVWGADGYRNWLVDDDARIKHRDLYIATDLSNKRMVAKALRVNPGFTVGTESISQRVESCEPKIAEYKAKIEDLKAMAGEAPEV